MLHELISDLGTGIGAGLESMSADSVGWKGSVNPKVCNH